MKNFSKTHKENLSKALSNRKFSYEHKKNLSLSHKGKKLPKFSEEHRKKLSLAGKGKSKPPISLETRKKLSEARIKIILTGKFDSSGKKGYRGYYDEIYFHSSWELAFYVWNKEINKIKLIRNKSLRLKYTSDGKEFTYIPDFIDSSGVIYEIKGYLFSKRDNDKFNQTKDKVCYLFHKDLKEALNYCCHKYGNNFWSKLYLQ